MHMEVKCLPKSVWLKSSHPAMPIKRTVNKHRNRRHWAIMFSCDQPLMHQKSNMSSKIIQKPTFYFCHSLISSFSQCFFASRAFWLLSQKSMDMNNTPKIKLLITYLKVTIFIIFYQVFLMQICSLL